MMPASLLVETRTDSPADQTRQIEVLNRIGMALSGERDLMKLLAMIVAELRGLTSADAGSLYICEGNHLAFLVAQNATLDGAQEAGGAFKAFTMPLTRESIAGYVALTGDPLNLRDVYDLPDTSPVHFNRAFDQRTGYRSKSMLVLPMRDHNGEVIGVVQLINAIRAGGTEVPDDVVPFSKHDEALALSVASQAAVAIQNVRHLDALRELFRALVIYTATAIERRSPHTAGHSGRVAKYALRLARAVDSETTGPLAPIRFSDDKLEELRVTGWLHDVGKIGVREGVLEKMNKLTDSQMELIEARYREIKASFHLHGNASPDTLAALDDDLAFLQRINVPGYLTDPDLARVQAIAGRTYQDIDGHQRPYLTVVELENLSVRRGNLTAAEYREIQSHVVHSEAILRKLPFTGGLRDVPLYAAQHHELLDGSGYPRGLTAADLPLQSRILTVADIFDALTAKDRPYKKSMTPEQAVQILREDAAKGKLDPDLVDLFERRRLWERDPSVPAAAEAEFDEQLADVAPMG